MPSSVCDLGHFSKAPPTSENVGSSNGAQGGFFTVSRKTRQEEPARVSMTLRATRDRREGTRAIAVTRVFGTRVGVVARVGRPGAGTVGARVGLRAGVGIRACGHIVHMLAAGCRITGVVGADVPVVAIGRRPAKACPAGAGIARRTRAAIAAWIIVVGEDATGRRAASVRRTGIAVVA